MITFTVLGTLRGWDGDTELRLGSPQQKAVVASLLLHEGSPVGVSELIDQLWGEEPPPAASGTVRTYLSRLRPILGSAISGTASTGFRLERSGYQCDLDRLRDVVTMAEAAARAGDFAKAAACWRDASTMFAGAPLAGLPGPYLEAQRRRLAHLLEQVREGRLVADLAVGRVTDVLADLEPAIAVDPLREKLRELQVRALWQAGRNAEALEAYRSARDVLADELGIDPGEALQDLQRRILAGEPHEALPFEVGDSPPTSGVSPAQLPPSPSVLVGRAAETHWMRERVVGGQVRLVTITGMGGVGKTTLALSWAHELAADHPDGQLYVDLRGFDPTTSPTSPSDVLHGFLSALGVADAAVPEVLDDQVALYRSLVSTRRLLVVLDNARDADQVRPLLPGGASCSTLVTSRNPLVGLVATNGAHPVPLDVFAKTDSVDYLRSELSTPRIDAEPEAVERLVRMCAGLPLALAIVAARARVNPRFLLADLADDVAAHGAQALRAGDAAADINAVFSWSYGALTPAAAQLFRHLALHPAATIGRAAISSLGVLSSTETDRLLAQLLGAQLLTEQRPGRYSMHDLVRSYAQSLTTDEDERRLVLRRALDHYLHTAVGMTAVVFPGRPIEPIPEPAPGVVPESLDTRDEAIAWLDSEQAVLSEIVAEADRRGFDEHVRLLAWTLLIPQILRGMFRDAIAMHRLALLSANRSGDQLWIGILNLDLGVAFESIDQHEQVVEHAERALSAFAHAPDPIREAHTFGLLAHSHDTIGEVERGSQYRERAAGMFRSVGDDAGEGFVLFNEATTLLDQANDADRADRAARAVTLLVRARMLLRAENHLPWAALAAANLGQAYADSGELAQAHSVLNEAVDELAAHGEVVGRARALLTLGDVLDRLGDRERAELHWRQAAGLLEEHDPQGGHDRADRVRVRVAHRLQGPQRGQ